MSWFPLKGDECLRSNTAGFGYESFDCIYKETLGLTYFQWEKDFCPCNTRDVMVENPWIPVVAVVSYAVLILVGKNYFATRPAWNFRQTLAIWNFGLSAFSAIGCLRTAPQLIHNIANYGLQANLCFDAESNYGSGPTGFWVQMFILSKFPELLDTFFIVVHKKPLIFLHWYHHISVLLYSWHAYVFKAPAGLFFVAMNYGVHAIMYFYYFLMAVKMKPKWFNSMWITVAQISQMVVGVAVTSLSVTVHMQGVPECTIKPENNYAALVMYGSYLFLFLQFFFKRYTAKPKQKTV